MAYVVEDSGDTFSDYADGLLSNPAAFEAANQIEMPSAQFAQMREDFVHPTPLTEISNRLFSPRHIAELNAAALDYGQQFADSLAQSDMGNYWHVGTEGIPPEQPAASQPLMGQAAPAQPSAQFQGQAGVSMASLDAAVSGFGEIAESVSTQRQKTPDFGQNDPTINTSRMSQYLGELGTSFNQQGAAKPEDFDPQDPRFRNRGPGNTFS